MTLRKAIPVAASISDAAEGDETGEAESRQQQCVLCSLTESLRPEDDNFNRRQRRRNGLF